MKKGFELLRERNKGEEIDFPDQANLFPPLYKLFVESFQLGYEGLKYEKYCLTDDENLYRCDNIVYYYPSKEEGQDITFTCFDTIDKVVENFKYRRGYNESDEGLLRIGALALGGGLFVGLSSNNSDQVFYKIWDENNLINLSKNIFEFVRGLEAIGDTGSLKGQISIENLYKNWGEDFWRVRRDEQA